MIDIAQSIRVERTSPVPLQRQIREAIREGILAGGLQSKMRLPSWYELAGQLGVSRGTVKAAYEWLAGEGLIAGRGAQGTFVTADFARPIMPALPEPGLSGTDRFYPYQWGAPPLPFQLGVPALDQFPRALWSRTAGRAVRSVTLGTMVYPDPAGWLPLRAAIAGYVASARGVVCDPSQVFVTAGYTGALDLIARAVGQGRPKCWIEDPGFFRARIALDLAGIAQVAVPVDDAGIDVAAGVVMAPDARLALVTPSHQSPLGMAMSLPRRSALLNWATDSGAWIVEDDYYGEFRAKGRPIPALASLDGHGRTLYVGSFSKVMMPALRLGYIIVPPALILTFREITSFLAPAPAPMIQMALAEFIEKGHFARHIRRMIRLYGERREALAEALQATFGNTVRVDLQSNGIHLIAWFDTDLPDTELGRRAVSLGAAALSPWTVNRTLPPALILGFANVPAARARAEAIRLADALALA